MPGTMTAAERLAERLLAALPHDGATLTVGRAAGRASVPSGSWALKPALIRLEAEGAIEVVRSDSFPHWHLRRVSA